jgi:hypothetical protein
MSETPNKKYILDKLQTFFLELDKGFALVGKQYRIKVDNKYYQVDLVFYHRILRCFIVLHLQINKSQNTGSKIDMQMNYFNLKENRHDDNPSIGIVVTGTKNDIIIKYVISDINSASFSAKYQAYLPDIEELRTQLGLILK